jgi:hypothetical protein
MLLQATFFYVQTSTTDAMTSINGEKITFTCKILQPSGGGVSAVEYWDTRANADIHMYAITIGAVRKYLSCRDIRNGDDRNLQQ